MALAGKYLVGNLFAAAVIAGLVGGCAPVISNHGYTPVAEEVAQIQVGKDTRGSVRRKIGRPGGTGVFRDDGWFYVSTRIEHYAYNEPRVVDRRVVAIMFDPNDIVASVKEYGVEDGRVIDLETNTTPTYGREMTILEQVFGNIGSIPTSVFDASE